MRGRKVRFFSRVSAKLTGYHLAFNKVASGNVGEAFANIIADPTGLVEGALYDISEGDLSKLDEREGYPVHYNRNMLPLKRGDGSTVDAWVYTAQPNKVREGLKPTKEYLGHLLAGWDILSESYFHWLESFETLD